MILHRCPCGHVAEFHYREVYVADVRLPQYNLDPGTVARCPSIGCDCAAVEYGPEFEPVVVWRDPMVARWQARETGRRRVVNVAPVEDYVEAGEDW